MSSKKETKRKKDEEESQPKKSPNKKGGSPKRKSPQKKLPLIPELKNMNRDAEEIQDSAPIDPVVIFFPNLVEILRRQAPNILGNDGAGNPNRTWASLDTEIVNDVNGDGTHCGDRETCITDGFVYRFGDLDDLNTCIERIRAQHLWVRNDPGFPHVAQIYAVFPKSASKVLSTVILL